MFPKTLKLLWIQQKYYFRKNQQQICSKIRTALFFCQIHVIPFGHQNRDFPVFDVVFFFVCARKMKESSFFFVPLTPWSRKRKTFLTSAPWNWNSWLWFSRFCSRTICRVTLLKGCWWPAGSSWFWYFWIETIFEQTVERSGCFRRKWKLFAE